MNNDLEEFLSRLSKRRELERESPITKEVRELMDEINKETLRGKGNFVVVQDVGGYPGEVTFQLSWEGAITKRQKQKVGPLKLEVDPFHLNIRPFKDEESGSSRFKVTAKYEGGIDDPDIELGMTTKLDIGELKTLVQGQMDNIRQSSQS